MRIHYIFILLVIFVLSTGCAKQQFDKIAKQKAINDPVFSEDDGDNDIGEDDGNGGEDNTGEDDGNGDEDTAENDNDGDNDTGENDGGGEDNTGEEDDVDFICSNSRTSDVGYNLKSAQKLEIQIVDKQGKIVCKNSDTQLKQKITNTKSIPFEVCSAAAVGLSYHVRLVDLNKPNHNFIEMDDGEVEEMKDLLNFSGQVAKIVRTSTSAKFKIVNLDNSMASRKASILFDVKEASNGSDPLCDHLASPLVVKTVNEENRGLELTSQIDGILFDILGANSDPRAHAKKRISWITKDSYQFLVKPNSRNSVLGIDEMFGDNTKGPDGKFADDGYAALAKYDENKDKVIDARDKVYSQLKLWSDKNFDGKSERDELTSLADAGLEAVDLEYDDSFSEKDKYGNQTKMKSVVRYSDGSYKLIFDLWFNYKGKRERPDFGISLPVAPVTLRH